MRVVASKTTTSSLDARIDIDDVRLAELDAAGTEGKFFSAALVWSVWA
ncbi:hypothetical protein [Streptomyces europaeiscabiei]|nr:hypothetical protein [Streptomyces europaeiscabiei]MDX3862165.1 hypothetical protein [Streptomyces europaeiscabiei]MDX3873465.1 hypothetical protein [Streptomyces europaeiscabiei]